MLLALVAIQQDFWQLLSAARSSPLLPRSAAAFFARRRAGSALSRPRSRHAPARRRFIALKNSPLESAAAIWRQPRTPSPIRAAVDVALDVGARADTTATSQAGRPRSPHVRTRLARGLLQPGGQAGGGTRWRPHLPRQLHTARCRGRCRGDQRARR